MNRRKVLAILRMVPMIVVMGTIFILSAQPGDRFATALLPGIDKLAHAVAYGKLALTVLYVFSEDRKKNHPKTVMLLTVIFCVAFGVSDEFHQSYVPGRMASVLDLAADCVGAVAASLLYYRWRERRRTLLPQ